MSIMDAISEPTSGQMMLAMAIMGGAVILVFLIGHYHGMKKAVNHGPVASPQPKKQPKGAMKSRVVDSDHQTMDSGTRNSEEQNKEDENTSLDEQAHEGPSERNTEPDEDTRQEHWRSKENRKGPRVSTNTTSRFDESNNGSSTPTWRRSPKKSDSNANQEESESVEETWETGIVRFANDSFGFILRNKEQLPPQYSDKFRRRDGALFFLSNDVKFNLSLQRGDRVHYRVQPGNPRATGNKAKPKAADISLISRNGVRFDAKDKLQRMKWNRPRGDSHRRNSLPNTPVKSDARDGEEMENFAHKITGDDYDEDKVDLHSPVDMSKAGGSPARRGSLQDESITAFKSPSSEAWYDSRDTGFGYKFSGGTDASPTDNPYQNQVNYLRSRVMTEDVLRKQK